MHDGGVGSGGASSSQGNSRHLIMDAAESVGNGLSGTF